VDTFELAEPGQASFGFMTAENAERVKRQKEAPIFVIIGNPPYNSKQVDENDNNKNRRYPALDLRVSETYGRDSAASLLAKLRDPYVKAIRWASDRIAKNGEGIVAFVSNNSFLTEIAFDGARKHLASDFESIYVLDLGGNVWKNTKLSGTTHNVFGIKVGVSISLLVRRREPRANAARIYYSRFDEYWRKEQKLDALDNFGKLDSVAWQEINPDDKNSWLTSAFHADFGSFIAIADREAKTSRDMDQPVVFKSYSLGVATNRDDWMYADSAAALERRVETFIKNYNFEVLRYHSEVGTQVEVDEFINNDSSFVKWTDRLKSALAEGRRLQFTRSKLRPSTYRPFVQRYLYFDASEPTQIQTAPALPGSTICGGKLGNRSNSVGAQQPFATFAAAGLTDLNFFGSGTVPQWFPFYSYKINNKSRRLEPSGFQLRARSAVPN
jgi:predicted helicase